MGAGSSARQTPHSGCSLSEVSLHFSALHEEDFISGPPGLCSGHSSSHTPELSWEDVDVWSLGSRLLSSAAAASN